MRRSLSSALDYALPVAGGLAAWLYALSPHGFQLVARVRAVGSVEGAGDRAGDLAGGVADDAPEPLAVRAQ